MSSVDLSDLVDDDLLSESELDATGGVEEDPGDDAADARLEEEEEEEDILAEWHDDYEEDDADAPDADDEPEASGLDDYEYEDETASEEGYEEEDAFAFADDDYAGDGALGTADTDPLDDDAWDVSDFDPKEEKSVGRGAKRREKTEETSKNASADRRIGKGPDRDSSRSSRSGRSSTKRSVALRVSLRLGGVPSFAFGAPERAALAAGVSRAAGERACRLDRVRVDEGVDEEVSVSRGGRRSRRRVRGSARRLLAESRARGGDDEDDGDKSSRRLALAGETDLRVVVTCARVASAGDARSGARALRRGRALEKAARDAGLRVGAVTLVETAVEEE